MQNVVHNLSTVESFNRFIAEEAWPTEYKRCQGDKRVVPQYFKAKSIK